MANRVKKEKLNKYGISDDNFDLDCNCHVFREIFLLSGATDSKKMSALTRPLKTDSSFFRKFFPWMGLAGKMTPWLILLRIRLAVCTFHGDDDAVFTIPLLTNNSRLARDN